MRKVGKLAGDALSVSKDWEVEKLADVFEIRPPKREARGLLNENDLVSFLPMEDLDIMAKEIVAIKEKPLKEVSGSYTYFANNDVLLAKITPCFENGKLGIARNLKNGIGFGSSEYIVFRSQGKVIPEFLFYYLARDEFRRDGEKAMTGAAGQKRIPPSFIGAQEIAYPESLPEQQRIVSVLDEAFASIAQAKSNAERNLVNARELFESFAGIAFENPGDWEVKTLGEVCSLYQGIAINAKTKHALVEKSDLPLLRIKDLKNNTVEQYIDPNNYPKNALVNESDLIYTRTGQIGLVFTGKRGVLHNNSFKIVPESILSREYLFYWLQNPIFKSKIISLASRAAQPDITHELFKQQMISIPQLAEQRLIVGRLEALSAETGRLEEIYQQKVESLVELKKSVLQRAFAGEL